MRHIIPISGKDSLATAIVQAARCPDIDFEYVFNDTRAELPDTYEWLAQVETVMGISIVRAGKSLVDIIAEQKILPSPQTRYCTKYAKIFPMRDFIGKDKATIYLGIRADENRVGGQETRNISVAYPLREMGINLPLVYKIVGDRGLMPPAFFWQRIYDGVSAALGAQMMEWLSAELPAWVFAQLFAWRSRPNCFFCFYQRRYEWAGLLEHHPDLFTQAELLQDLHGYSENTKKHPFLWIGPGIGLSYIRKNFDRLVATRIASIVSSLHQRRQGQLFASLTDDLDAAPTSCGLYCGK